MFSNSIIDASIISSNFGTPVELDISVRDSPFFPTLNTPSTGELFFLKGSVLGRAIKKEREKEWLCVVRSYLSVHA